MQIKNRKVKYIAFTAMFAALIFAATMLQIPVGSGYVHLGDALIYLAASILPFPYGLIAASLGGVLADAVSPFIIFAPGTLVVKALLTLSFTNKREKIICPRNLVATVIALPITVGGYFLYTWIVFDFAAGLADVVSNVGQAAASAALYIVLAFALDRLSFKHRINSL